MDYLLKSHERRPHSVCQFDRLTHKSKLMTTEPRISRCVGGNEAKEGFIHETSRWQPLLAYDAWPPLILTHLVSMLGIAYVSTETTGPCVPFPGLHGKWPWSLQADCYPQPSSWGTLACFP